MFKSVFFMFSILSELRFVRDVLLRNRIGASIKLKICETGSNFKSFARPPRPHKPSPEEEDQHKKFIACLKNPLWFKVGT